MLSPQERYELSMLTLQVTSQVIDKHKISTVSEFEETQQELYRLLWQHAQQRERKQEERWKLAARELAAKEKLAAKETSNKETTAQSNYDQSANKLKARILAYLEADK